MIWARPTGRLCAGVACAMASALLVLAGCKSSPDGGGAGLPASGPPADSGAVVPGAAGKQSPRRALEPVAIQSQVMDFSDDFILRLSEVVDRIEGADPPLPGRLLAHKLRLRTAQGVLQIASSSNPVVSLADMLVMVSIQRRLLEEAYVSVEFGDEWESLTQVFRRGEEQIGRLAAQTLSEAQLTTIQQLIDAWIAEHPDRQIATSVRLDDFSGMRQEAVLEERGGGLPSVLGLLRLDPLSGLDPTTRQIEQSRLLGERAFFYAQRAPQLLAWQVELLYVDIAQEREVQSLLASSRTITESFETMTGEVGELREELPELVAAEREAAIDQAFDRLTQERQALLDELEARDEGLRTTLGELRQTIQAAEGLVAHGDELADSVTLLAERFERDPDAEPGPELADYERVIEKVDAALLETRALVDSIDELASSDAWDERVETIDRITDDLNAEVAGISEDLERRLDRLISRLFEAGVWLVVIALAGVLIVGIAIRLTPSRRRVHREVEVRE